MQILCILSQLMKCIKKLSVYREIRGLIEIIIILIFLFRRWQLLGIC